MHREHRDQPHDLLADALGLRVLRAARPLLRPGQVADRQIGDLALPDRRQPHRGVGEAELGQPRAGVDLERLAHLRVDLIALLQRAHDLQAGRLARAPEHAVDGADDRRLPRRLGPARQQIAQERHGGVLAQVLGRHAQRVEHAAQRRVGLQRHALGVRRDLLQQVKAVVALRVAVDDPRALQEALVLELLIERRLARAERADAEDRRVAVALGPLAAG